MKKSHFFKLMISLIIPIALGSIAGMATSQAIPEWYASLKQPPFAPPDWVFGPVWTVLYLLMGYSLFLIWKQDSGKIRNQALFVFGLQMLLNFCWTFIFFYFHLLGLAVIEIILLWLCIAMMLKLFYKVNPLACYLNIPYLLWVTFAAVLTASHYLLNGH